MWLTPPPPPRAGVGLQRYLRSLERTKKSLSNGNTRRFAGNGDVAIVNIFGKCEKFFTPKMEYVHVRSCVQKFCNDSKWGSTVKEDIIIKAQPTPRNLSATAIRVPQCTCPVAVSRKYPEKFKNLGSGSLYLHTNVCTPKNPRCEG
jgi:hypothetical protein